MKLDPANVVPIENEARDLSDYFPTLRICTLGSLEGLSFPEFNADQKELLSSWREFLPGLPGENDINKLQEWIEIFRQEDWPVDSGHDANQIALINRLLELDLEASQPWLEKIILQMSNSQEEFMAFTLTGRLTAEAMNGTFKNEAGAGWLLKVFDRIIVSPPRNDQMTAANLAGSFLAMWFLSVPDNEATAQQFRSHIDKTEGPIKKTERKYFFQTMVDLLKEFIPTEEHDNFKLKLEVLKSDLRRGASRWNDSPFHE